jgi:hypothetical protein
MLFFLTSIVVISGCIGQGEKVPTGSGIIIKDFYFDYTPIYVNDTIGLNLELQNLGGVKGYINKITIFGVDWKYGGSGALVWGVPQGEDFVLNETSAELPVSLAPPDPTTGFEGEIWSWNWFLQAPGGLKSPTTFDFQVRVEYNYSTTYTGTIRIIDSDYLRTLPEDERNKLIQEGGVVESTVTSGPLSVSAASGRHFIVQTTGDKRAIRFKVSNIGGGFPFIENTTKGLYQVRITDNMTLFDCDSEFRMSRGKTGWFKCYIQVPSKGEFVNKLDKKFSVKLVYDYYVDSATSVTVNPIYVETGVTPSQLG